MAAGRYHWSNCAYPAVFFKIDAIASIPWVVFLLNPGWMTLKVSVVISGFLIYIELFKKMTFSAFLRSLLVRATGRVKSTMNLIKEISR